MQAKVNAGAPAKKYLMQELSKGCSMYDPCPICFKCKNKASHLYIRCQGCAVQFCAHSHKQIAWAIRRENFAITVSDKTKQAILAYMEERREPHVERK